MLWIWPQGNVAMLVATCCIVGPRKVTPLPTLRCWHCPAPVLTLAGGRLAQQMRSMGQPKRIITSLVFVGEPLAPTEVASVLLHTEI